MHRLKDVPREEWVERRMDVAESAAAEWLDQQGKRDGFAQLRSCNPDVRLVQDYRVLEIPRQGRLANDKRHRLRVGVLDLDGRLEVTDPTVFLERLYRGFGRAKAFGNGLMLIRRV